MTDSRQIASLYSTLARFTPSPVVELNSAVAVAMAEGPDRGLMLLDRSELAERPAHFHLFHIARADLLRRQGRREEAARAYLQALEVCGNAAERRFPRRRLQELEG